MKFIKINEIYVNVDTIFSFNKTEQNTTQINFIKGGCMYSKETVESFKERLEQL